MENLCLEVKKELDKSIDKTNNRINDCYEKIFDTNSRISLNEVLKGQFEVFKQKQEQ